MKVGDLVMLSFDWFDRQGYDDYSAYRERKAFGYGVVLSLDAPDRNFPKDKWGNTYSVFFPNRGKSYKYSEHSIEVISASR